ncbi:MAG: HDOD domain-containing protein [Aquificae bacterium]|nr:HDOD domain-containing protein [Aquificota bacterium]
MSFVIARQAVYDREGRVFAYEVYLRSSEDPSRYPREVSFSRAAYIIADILAEYGVRKIAQGKKLIVNLSLEAVLNKSIDILPHEDIIYALNEPEVPVGETLGKLIKKKVSELKRRGAGILISPSLYRREYSELVALGDIVEFRASEVLSSSVSGAKGHGKRVLVSYIENEEEYKRALESGADYFEGNFLEPPVVVEEARVTPFLKGTLLRLMSMLSSAKSLKEVADTIASDVGMAVKFLRFVNSAYFSRRKKIEDIHHAVSYVGLENVKRFVLLVALNEYMKLENPELWKRSLIRAHIAEALAGRSSSELSQKAFLVGLFSLLDEILGVDIPSFLRELHVDEEVVRAFEDENSVLARILKLTERLEGALREGAQELEKTAEELSSETGLRPIELVVTAKEAQQKADEVIRL